MKYILCLLVSVLLFVGCGKKGENAPVSKDEIKVDSTELKLSASSNPNQSVNLTYKLEKDKTYRYRLVMLTDQEMSQTGTVNRSDKGVQTLIYIMNLTPVNVDNDGTMDIRFNIVKVKMDVNATGKKITYESGVTKDTAGQFFDQEAMVNNPFEARISKSGEIVEVSKTDKIVAKLIELAKGKIDVNQKEQLKGQIVDGQLKPLIGQIFRELPLNSVNKNYTWTKDQAPSQMPPFTVKSKNVYKIQDLGELSGDKVITLNIGLETIFEGKKEISQNGANYKFNDPKLITEGKVYFNVDKGYPQQVKTHFILEQSFSATGKDQKGQMQKGDQSQRIDRKTIVDLLK
ncbi:MAG: DUF6263 family protein [Bacteroidota bacterium]|nr:DUF6263 family protein [Bacteroidota bacterium]